MQKVTRFLMFYYHACSGLSFMKPAKEKINWITIAELNELYYKNPRPILWMCILIGVAGVK